MTKANRTRTVGVTARSAFDLRVEEAVFDGLDVTLRPVDIETTDSLMRELADVDAVIDRLLAASYTSAVIDSLDHCEVIDRCGIGVDGVDDEIAGAGLDVFEMEPSSQGDAAPPFESPLRDLGTVVLTPHVAWFSQEANEERRRTAARDVRRVLEGTDPENPVSEPQ